MTPPLALHDVTLRRGAFTLSIPRLDAEPGTVIGLVGRNGAGKSTLLELLAGLQAPDAGTVRVLGVDPVADPVTARRQLALMTDDQPVFNLTIAAHLRALAGFYPTWDDRLVGELLTRFELDPGKRLLTLSKGEATRARLVFALAFRPKLLLLDEPGTGLDVPNRRKMLASVLEVVRDPGRTVVISSHDTADVERIADRLVLVDQGRVIADGPTDAVVGEGRTLEELLAGGAS